MYASLATGQRSKYSSTFYLIHSLDSFPLLTMYFWVMGLKTFQPVVLGATHMAWVPGSWHSYHVAETISHWTSGGRFHWLSCSVRVWLIAWRPRHPFLGKCRRAPRHFWSRRAFLGYCHAPSPHFKMALWHTLARWDAKQIPPLSPRYSDSSSDFFFFFFFAVDHMAEYQSCWCLWQPLHYTFFFFFEKKKINLVNDTLKFIFQSVAGNSRNCHRKKAEFVAEKSWNCRRKKLKLSREWHIHQRLASYWMM